MTAILLALNFILGNLQAQASEKPDCGDAQASGVKYTYCVQKAATSNPDVLLYLHGGGGDHEQWFREGGFNDQFADAFRKSGKAMPSIITFSFGEAWLLGDVATSEHPAYLPSVETEILPFLEQKVGRGGGRLFVMGPSMGGYNTAVLALRLREKLKIAKALPLCPGMIPLPFEPTSQQVDTYLKENSPNISRRALENTLAWVKADFQTAQNWSRHNPLELAEQAPLGSMRFYVSSTYDDDYGFFEGAKAFASSLKRRGAVVQTSFDKKGRHCEETYDNVPAMARFLTED